jgi:hypothetical protein
VQGDHHHRRALRVATGRWVRRDTDALAQPGSDIGVEVDAVPACLPRHLLEEDLPQVVTVAQLLAERRKLPDEPESVDLLPRGRIQVELGEPECAGRQGVLRLAAATGESPHPVGHPGDEREHADAGRADEQPRRSPHGRGGGRAAGQDVGRGADVGSVFFAAGAWHGAPVGRQRGQRPSCSVSASGHR